MYPIFVKPFFDFLFSLVALTLFLPVLVVVYFLLKFGSIDNPFFYQPRPGKDEKVFRIMKFKTMTDEKNENGELLPDDKRVTRLGNILRKTSLDELPQLFNVLKGKMSLVGPRPLRVRYLPFYTSREKQRHSIKPGITGLAQVSGRNALEWDKRLELDAWYAENIGFVLDCKILLKTVVKIFKSSETEFSEGPDSLDAYRKMKMNDRASPIS